MEQIGQIRSYKNQKSPILIKGCLVITCIFANSLFCGKRLDISTLLRNFLTLFYMGFWRYVNTWGGAKIPPG